MKYLSYRFAWLTILGVVLSFGGFFLGYFNKTLAFYCIGVGAFLFAFGNFLVVLFPKPEHSEKFQIHLKWLVAGFFLILIGFGIGVSKVSEDFSDAVYYVGVAMFLWGMFSQYRAKKNY